MVYTGRMSSIVSFHFLKLTEGYKKEKFKLDFQIEFATNWIFHKVDVFKN